MDVAIVTTGLTKHYGTTIGIADLNLEVRRGEVCGFVGPNGAGKTTTIRLLLGLLRPTRGNIKILGRNINRNPQTLLHRIGYLPGDVGLYRDMTGIQYLHHLLRLKTRKPSADILKRVEDLQCRFDIDFHRKIGVYSKGMRQIVGIIQAFMHNPELIILDEPTSGLDPMMQERFYELLAEERERGTSIFLSSHILTEVTRVCDRVMLVKDGHLVRVDEIETYKTRLGKRITLQTDFPDGELHESLKRLEGISGITVKGNQIQFFFNGDMKSLILFMAQIEVADFLCEPLGIEHVFLDFYRE